MSTETFDARDDRAAALWADEKQGDGWTPARQAALNAWLAGRPLPLLGIIPPVSLGPLVAVLVAVAGPLVAVAAPPVSCRPFSAVSP